MGIGAYSPGGSEFLVNSTVTGLQTDATIAALAGGGVVVCWTDSSGLGGDASGSSIKAQLYDASGAKVGGERLVNTVTANAQSAASVTALAGGGYVVSWTDASGTGADPSQQGVKAQIFNAAGGAVGGEFLVNTATPLNQNAESIASLSDGGFVVTWVDASATAPDAQGTGVRGQRYDSTGHRVGGEFLVNTTIAGSQIAPAVTGLAGGGFVATWTDGSGLGGDNSSLSIKAQVFSASGAKLGGEFLVNSTISGAQDQPTIASLSNGGFVVAWRDTSMIGDPSGSGIKAQVYDASGVKVGGEFLVNTTTYNAQDQPVVTGIPGGGFAVSWRDNSNLSGDASGFGIKSQVFDDHGNKVGSEFQVNSTTTGNQEMPAITALASGALVYGWSDASGQGGDLDGGIKAKIFAPTSGAITGLSLSQNTVSEAATENTAIAAISASGAFNSDFTYAILDDSTGAFGVRDNQLIVLNSLALDYETSSTATLSVRATDTFGNTFDQVFTLNIADAVIEDRFVGGEEMLANTAVHNAQLQSSIAALSGGRYLMTWMDGSGQGADTSGYGIKAQIVDATGARLGTEFLVNTQTLNTQSAPATAALSSGGFVIAWVDASLQGGDSSVSGIKAQLYDDNGAPVGSEFLVNQSTLNAQTAPAVSALSTGGFVITWTDASLQGGDSSVSSIKAQIYGQSGAPVGSEFLVNTNTANGQDSETVAGLAGGGFVISWRDSSQIGGDTSKDAVKAQIFSASGAPLGAEFLVNTQTAGNQQQESIAALDTGGFVIAWADSSGKGGDTDNFGIKMQIYDASGTKIGGETLVNSTTAGAQIAPNVVEMSDGRFMVSWADYSGLGVEAGTAGIKAQIFADDGTKIGGEFAVDTQALGNQVDPAAAAGAGGAFALTWTDYSGVGTDSSSTGVKFKLFQQLGAQGPPPPLVATADHLTATEDTPAIYQAADLVANDVDSLGLPVSLASVTAVSGGTVSLDPSGQITFTPFANFNGNAAFTYIATDDAGYTSIGHVTVAVAPVNDPPTAVADAISVSEDATVIKGSALLANDTDPDFGDKLTIQSVSATSALGLPLTLSAGDIAYAAASQFQYLGVGQTLTDSFDYTISDLAGLTSTAHVSLTIVGANDAPTNLTLTGANVDENAANGTVVGQLAAFDIDQGDTLTYTLSNNAGGRFAVDPTTGVVTVANGSLLDYETATTQTITVHVVDHSGAFVDASFTITLNNLPEPKSWTGDNGVNVFTAPTNDLWTINGLGGNDVLTGNASADTIYGGSGNDTLNGAGGADTLVGGTGNDVYYVDNPGDVIVENYGEGTDQVYSSISYTLPDNVENLAQSGNADVTFYGNAFANTMIGSAGANVMYGGNGGDLLQGGDGNDTLYGEAGNDYLLGGNGNDILVGGAGVDELTGGAGADVFVFDSLTTSADRDKVKDFNASEGDVFQIAQQVFTGFSGLPLGAVPASAFVNGAQATTPDQHLIYQQSTGNLYYDADGVGGAAQVQIAVLSTMPALTSSNFILV